MYTIQPDASGGFLVRDMLTKPPVPFYLTKDWGFVSASKPEQDASRTTDDNKKNTIRARRRR